MAKAKAAGQLEQARASLEELRSQHVATATALAEARAELDVVTDENRAVTLTGLVAARANRSAQLEKQIEAAEAEIKAAAKEVASEKAEQLQAAMNEKLPEFGRRLWELRDMARDLAQMEAEQRSAAAAAKEERLFPAPSSFGGTVGAIEGILHRYGFGVSAAGPEGLTFTKVK